MLFEVAEAATVIAVLLNSVAASRMYSPQYDPAGEGVRLLSRTLDLAVALAEAMVSPLSPTPCSVCDISQPSRPALRNSLVAARLAVKTAVCQIFNALLGLDPALFRSHHTLVMCIVTDVIGAAAGSLQGDTSPLARQQRCRDAHNCAAVSVSANTSGSAPLYEGHASIVLPTRLLSASAAERQLPSLLRTVASVAFCLPPERAGMALSALMCAKPFWVRLQEAVSLAPKVQASELTASITASLEILACSFWPRAPLHSVRVMRADGKPFRWAIPPDPSISGSSRAVGQLNSVLSSVLDALHVGVHNARRLLEVARRSLALAHSLAATISPDLYGSGRWVSNGGLDLEPKRRMLASVFPLSVGEIAAASIVVLWRAASAFEHACAVELTPGKWSGSAPQREQWVLVVAQATLLRLPGCTTLRLASVGAAAHLSGSLHIKLALLSTRGLAAAEVCTACRAKYLDEVFWDESLTRHQCATSDTRLRRALRVRLKVELGLLPRLDDDHTMRTVRRGLHCSYLPLVLSRCPHASHWCFFSGMASLFEGHAGGRSQRAWLNVVWHSLCILHEGAAHGAMVCMASMSLGVFSCAVLYEALIAAPSNGHNNPYIPFPGHYLALCVLPIQLPALRAAVFPSAWHWLHRRLPFADVARRERTQRRLAFVHCHDSSKQGPQTPATRWSMLIGSNGRGSPLGLTRHSWLEVGRLLDLLASLPPQWYPPTQVSTMLRRTLVLAQLLQPGVVGKSVAAPNGTDGAHASVTRGGQAAAPQMVAFRAALRFAITLIAACSCAAICGLGQRWARRVLRWCVCVPPGMSSESLRRRTEGYCVSLVHALSLNALQCLAAAGGALAAHRGVGNFTIGSGFGGGRDGKRGGEGVEGALSVDGLRLTDSWLAWLGEIGAFWRYPNAIFPASPRQNCGSLGAPPKQFARLLSHRAALSSVAALLSACILVMPPRLTSATSSSRVGRYDYGILGRSSAHLGIMMDWLSELNESMAFDLGASGGCDAVASFALRMIFADDFCPVILSAPTTPPDMPLITCVLLECLSHWMRAIHALARFGVAVPSPPFFATALCGTARSLRVGTIIAGPRLYSAALDLAGVISENSTQIRPSIPMASRQNLLDISFDLVRKGSMSSELGSSGRLKPWQASTPLAVFKRLLGTHGACGTFGWALGRMLHCLRASSDSCKLRAALLGISTACAASSSLLFALRFKVVFSLLDILFRPAAALTSVDADGVRRLALQALTALATNDQLRFRPPDGSAFFLAAGSVGCPPLELCHAQRARSHSSAAAFGASYFLAAALLRQRGKLVHAAVAGFLTVARYLLHSTVRGSCGAGNVLATDAQGEWQLFLSERTHDRLCRAASPPVGLDCVHNVRRLLEEMASHRKALVRHGSYVLAELVVMLRERPLLRSVHRELLPGMHAILGMCTVVEVQAVHATSDPARQLVLGWMLESYEASFKYRGMV